MEQNSIPTNRILLDPVAQFYVATLNDTCPGTFSISAHLKEDVNPIILQNAVNDLIDRLPFLNGNIKQSFFHVYNEMQVQPLQIENVNDFSTFGTCHKPGRDKLFRVYYNENGFKLETTHIVCDGRSLVKIMTALLARYFELLGVTVDKSGIIDCNGNIQDEELENAFEKYSSAMLPEEAKAAFTRYTASQNSGKPKVVYQRRGFQPIDSRIITGKYDTEKIKTAAKRFNVTVTELITAYIFKVVAEEREEQKSTNPISLMLPIDFRTFFPSKTLTNFTQGKIIYMPESDDFSEILRQIKLQFEKITTAGVSDDIIGFNKIFSFIKFIPLPIKKRLLKLIKRSASAGNTTIFSNLGLVKLPAGIEERLDMLEFALCPETESEFYSFSCVTIGNTLALTVSTGVEGERIANKLLELINNI